MARKKTSNSGASGSGHSSPGAASGTSAVRGHSGERVGNYPLTGLSQKWDDDVNTRSRIREGHYLCRHMNEQTKELDGPA